MLIKSTHLKIDHIEERSNEDILHSRIVTNRIINQAEKHMNVSSVFHLFDSRDGRTHGDRGRNESIKHRRDSK